MLGCHDVQGFQIARPMPVKETIQWATAYFPQTLRARALQTHGLTHLGPG
jgi:hypothetical protein